MKRKFWLVPYAAVSLFIFIWMVVGLTSHRENSVVAGAKPAVSHWPKIRSSIKEPPPSGNVLATAKSPGNITSTPATATSTATPAGEATPTTAATPGQTVTGTPASTATPTSPASTATPTSPAPASASTSTAISTGTTTPGTTTSASTATPAIGTASTESQTPLQGDPTPVPPIIAVAPPANKPSSSGQKTISLTFDDGPDNVFTPQILDILKRYNIKATFFVVGLQVDLHPEMLKRISQEGHVIGNHTYAHENLTKLPLTELQETVTRTDRRITEITGIQSNLLRAPYGAFDASVKQILTDMGYRLIGWNIETNDWRGLSVMEIVDSVKNAAAPGSIILQHCYGGKKLQNTVAALPLIIEYLQEQGYQFVTIS